MRLAIAAAAALLVIVPASARHHRHYGRQTRLYVARQPVTCQFFQPCPQQNLFQPFQPLVEAPVKVARAVGHAVRHVVRATERVFHETATYLAHPPGCPHVAFCGCGAAYDLGLHDRSLWLASSWFRFPRSEPAPNTVAVRRHHVFVLKEHIQGMMWRVNNYNGRGHRSQSYIRSIAGYTIVRPN